MDESVPAHRDAPASSSHKSASGPRGKVVSGKHSIFDHFPKDRKCDTCLRTKINRGSLQKTHWYSRAQIRKMVILQLRITKLLAKDVNLDTIIDTL